MSFIKFMRRDMGIHVITTAIIAILMLVITAIPFVIVVGMWYLLTFALLWPVYRVLGRRIKFLDFGLFKSNAAQPLDTSK